MPSKSDAIVRHTVATVSIECCDSSQHTFTLSSNFLCRRAGASSSCSLDSASKCSDTSLTQLTFLAFLKSTFQRRKTSRRGRLVVLSLSLPDASIIGRTGENPGRAVAYVATTSFFCLLSLALRSVFHSLSRTPGPCSRVRSYNLPLLSPFPRLLLSPFPCSSISIPLSVP